MPRPPTVFISYRREDSQAWAGRIADFLENQTNLRVLLDVDSIERGVDYTKAIAQQIKDSDVVLALVGRDWLDAKDSVGERRLEDPDDPVRVEIENALRQDKKVIPVLVDGSSLPSRKMLPASIGDLAVRNGITLTHESFRRDLRYLVEDLGGSEVGLGASNLEHPIAAVPRRADPNSSTHIATPGSVPSTSRRIVATLVDSAPLVAGVMLEPAAKQGNQPAGWVYVSGIILFALFIAACLRPGTRSGQTIGKQALGIQAVGAELKATRLRLLGREVLKYLWAVPVGAVSALVIPIVYLHRRTRLSDGVTWHDRVAGARVGRVGGAALAQAQASLEVPARFANQNALEDFASQLTRDQFIELVAVLRSRGWTQAEIQERVQPLRPSVPVD